MNREYQEIAKFNHRLEMRRWHYLGAFNLAFAAFYYWLFFG